MENAVGPVARDERAAVGGEGDAVRHGAVEAGQLLGGPGMKVDPAQPGHVALHDPEPAAVGADRAAVREMGDERAKIVTSACRFRIIGLVEPLNTILNAYFVTQEPPDAVTTGGILNSHVDMMLYFLL